MSRPDFSQPTGGSASPNGGSATPNGGSATPNGGSAFRGAALAVGVGLVLGLIIVFFAVRGARFADRDTAAIEIHINGVDPQMARDVLLPNMGWVLEVALPRGLPETVRDSLQVTLRAERTGAMIEISDQLVRRGERATLVIPESLGLFEGLLSIRATLVDGSGMELEAYRRIRIRRWLGGPPIGSREIIQFDFSVDRDADGTPDFERDLEGFGLASPDRPELAKIISRRIAERALDRVRRAYDPTDDPNRTGLPRDQVFVRFMLDTDPGPFVTRICVGGRNLAHPESIGNVQFDDRNARKSSNECDPRSAGENGESVSVAAGLFPAEFEIYRDSPLYREVLAPFRATEGGTPIGRNPLDAEAAREPATASPGRASASEARLPRRSPRSAAIDRAVAVFGDALGTVMAHESAHALGLVAPGKPGIGLFGGSESEPEHYAHNLDVEGHPPSDPWLMNPGTSFRFEDLAGLGETGELRFRPLNHAYLKDRIVLVDGRP